MTAAPRAPNRGSGHAKQSENSARQVDIRRDDQRQQRLIVFGCLTGALGLYAFLVSGIGYSWNDYAVLVYGFLVIAAVGALSLLTGVYWMAKVSRRPGVNTVLVTLFLIALGIWIARWMARHFTFTHGG